MTAPRWAAVTLAALLVAGCGSDVQRGTAVGHDRGGDLTYLDAEAPASLQIQVGYWQNSLLKDQMLDRLVYQDPQTFEFVPWIAEKWTVDPSKRSYEFTIREGASYSNGQPVDAESVRRNLDWEANGDKAKGITRNVYFPEVDSVTADPARRTVRVTPRQTVCAVHRGVVFEHLGSGRRRHHRRQQGKAVGGHQSDRFRPVRRHVGDSRQKDRPVQTARIQLGTGHRTTPG